jgi:hypothetical protein
VSCLTSLCNQVPRLKFILISTHEHDMVPGMKTTLKELKAGLLQCSRIVTDGTFRFWKLSHICSNLYGKHYNNKFKKFWEETISYFLLMRHATLRDESLIHFFVAVRICLPSRCLTKVKEYIKRP